jgi:hypothetical protein
MVADERGCTRPARDVATGASHQLSNSSVLLLRSDASTALAAEKVAAQLRGAFEQQFGRRARHMTLWDTLELFGIQVNALVSLRS